MIKICHFVDTLGIGGLEKTVVAIVKGLPEYEHQVWCLKQKGVLGEELESAGIKVRGFNLQGRLSLSALFKLHKEIKKERFSIIHSHGIFPAIWALSAAIFSRGPIEIVHCQNVYIDMAFKERLKFKLLSCFITKVVAVSQAVKKFMVQSLGINPRKIAVIYNSAPAYAALVLDQRLSIRKSVGIMENDFVVGNISRLEQHKGHSYLIDAIGELHSRLPLIKCLIVGDGPARKGLESKVQELGIKEKVIFCGWRQDLGNLISIMDVFMQPSTLKEGLPLALAEAASAGLPLIVTDIGGNAEIVQEGINGFIVPAKNSSLIAEKIFYLAQQGDTRKTMGESSRKIWQEKFTRAGMIREIGKLYSDEISKHHYT